MYHNRDNGYLKAQREYDAQLPPSCEDSRQDDEDYEGYEAEMERRADQDREDRMMELQLPEYYNYEANDHTNTTPQTTNISPTTNIS